MAKYKIQVYRVEERLVEMTIEAPDDHTAKEIAYDRANDTDFRADGRVVDVTYRAESV